MSVGVVQVLYDPKTSIMVLYTFVTLEGERKCLVSTIQMIDLKTVKHFLRTLNTYSLAEMEKGVLCYVEVDEPFKDFLSISNMRSSSEEAFVTKYFVKDS